MLSIGKQLMQARLDSGETIEDAAFSTRIPRQRLREMENDDFSNFANLTYAKGFLKLYSRHLGVDLGDYLEQFDTEAVAAVSGREYARRVYTLNDGLNNPNPASVAPRFREGFDVFSSAGPALPRAGVNAALAGAGVLALVVCFFKFSSSADDPGPAERQAAPVAASAAEPSVSRRNAAAAPVELALINDRVNAPAETPPAPAPENAVKTVPVAGASSSSRAEPEARVPRIIPEENEESAAEKNRASRARSGAGNSEVRRARGV